MKQAKGLGPKEVTEPLFRIVLMSCLLFQDFWRGVGWN